MNSLIVYLTHINPQHLDVFALDGNTKPHPSVKISIGPAKLTTTGILRSSAALNPEDVRKSTTTISGLISLSSSLMYGVHISLPLYRLDYLFVPPIFSSSLVISSLVMTGIHPLPF